MTATAPAWHDALRVDWPAAEHGRVSLRRFEVTPDAARLEAMRSAFSGGRGVPAGHYTGLYIGGHLWMSDTPDEQHDHVPFLRQVRRLGDRRVLVTGLGLGMVVRALTCLPDVDHVTVCDNHPDVVALVGPLVRDYGAARGTEVDVVLGDARTPADTFAKGTRWDAAWHDIWPDLCTDNLTEMTTMARRYARRVGWQDFWCRDLLRAHRRRERRAG